MGAAARGLGRAALIVVVVLSVIAGAPPGTAATHADVSVDRHPTIVLTVSPGLTVTRGSAVTVTALVVHTAAAGDVRFYDGIRLMATRQRTHGQLSVAWVTGGLKTGIHRVHATFSVAAHRQPVAVSPFVSLLITGVPTIADQTIVVRVPAHRMPEPTAQPAVSPSAQVNPPHSVLGTSERRGGAGVLAYTGVNALLLLVLAGVLLVSGALLRASGRARLRRGLRAGAVGSGAGALALGAVFATGADAARAPDPEVRIVGTPAPLGSVEWPGGSPPSMGVTEGARVAPGGRVTLVADGFRPGERVRVLFDERAQLPDAVADVAGRVHCPLTIASGTTPGPHTVKLTGSLLHDGVVLVVTPAG